jgi:hypothetical protein
VRSPFLNDVFGSKLADDFRSIFGSPLVPDSPYGLDWHCDCGASYLGAALSSVWALLVLLLAFAAGLVFRQRRRAASWMLAGGAALSLVDTGVRVFERLQRYPVEYTDLMMARLPIQIAANAFFQFALPLVTGLAVTLTVQALHWLVSDRR